MRLDRFWIGEYKNLKDVTVDFDEDHWVTVVIGWNGTGKSNVLEALATLFGDLITQEKAPTFSYKLRYEIHNFQVHIDADPSRKKEKYIIHVADRIGGIKDTALREPEEGSEWIVDGKKIPLAQFLRKRINICRAMFSAIIPALRIACRRSLKNTSQNTTKS